MNTSEIDIKEEPPGSNEIYLIEKDIKFELVKHQNEASEICTDVLHPEKSCRSNFVKIEVMNEVDSFDKVHDAIIEDKDYDMKADIDVKNEDIEDHIEDRSHILNNDVIWKNNFVDTERGITNEHNSTISSRLGNGNPNIIEWKNKKRRKEGNKIKDSESSKNIKPDAKFECDLCEYKTNLKRSLKSHSLVHSQMKLFKCSECDYVSNQKNNLKRHLLSHSNMKLLKCTESDNECNIKCNLTKMCVIEGLLTSSFSKRDIKARQLVINNGRPMPKLPNLRSSNKKCVRHFQTNLYEKKKWLTGCAELNKLFCWPCLLFSLEKTVWNDNGFEDLNNIHMAMLKHERSQRHIKCLIDLKIFGKVGIDLQIDDQKRLSIQQHNEKVKHNRAIMRRMIDAVIFIGRQELSFRGHFESDISNNHVNYKELLYLFSKYDEKLAHHLETATIFSGLLNEIQNDLIDAIQKAMLNEIENEINQAKFVAILLDETSDTTNISQLSTVLRYVTKDCVTKERFIGFSDVSADRSANALSEHVFKCIEIWRCENKVIAQTYDGAAIMAGQLNELQSKVRKKFESAVFIHCCTHMLNLVLSQVCSSMKECKIFFSTINSLGTYLNESSRRISALDNIIKKRFPKAAPARWNHSSRLVNTVKENQDVLNNYFQNVIENPELWDEVTINSAIGFNYIFKDPDFLFLLELFSEIFSITDVLCHILQTKNLDIMYCKEQIDNARSQLEIKLDNFSLFYKKFEEKYDKNEETSTRRCNNKSVDAQQIYKILYSKIIGIIIDEIKVRYLSLEELKFLELLNFSRAREYCKRFPAEALNSLKATYGNFFDIIRLQSELCVLYSMENFMKQSICNLMHYIHANDLTDAMPELFKLCHLVLTIPSTTASEERSFPALNRIKSYQRNSAEEKLISGLALMSIERDFLQHQIKSEDLYEKIINIFAQKDRRFELIYD